MGEIFLGETMDLPNPDDILENADPEFLDTLARKLLRAGYGLSGNLFLVELNEPYEVWKLIWEQQEGSDRARTICSTEPAYAYKYALRFDECPHDETRKGALQAPEWALFYALEIDKCPREDTRTAACEDPQCAFEYARGVDECPRDDTRKGACQDHQHAFNYMAAVDCCYHEETWTAVRGTELEPRYKDLALGFPDGEGDGQD